MEGGESEEGERRSGCGSTADKPSRPLALTSATMTSVIKSEKGWIRKEGGHTAVPTLGFVKSNVFEDSTSCRGAPGRPSDTKTLVAPNGAGPLAFILRVVLLWVVSWPTTNSSPPILIVSVAIQRG